MNTITILAMIAILSGVATLSISGFTVINTVFAQMADNTTVNSTIMTELVKIADYEQSSWSKAGERLPNTIIFVI